MTVYNTNTNTYTCRPQESKIQLAIDWNIGGLVCLQYVNHQQKVSNDFLEALKTQCSSICSWFWCINNCEFRIISVVCLDVIVTRSYLLSFPSLSKSCVSHLDLIIYGGWLQWILHWKLMKFCMFFVISRMKSSWSNLSSHGCKGIH